MLFFSFGFYFPTLFCTYIRSCSILGGNLFTLFYIEQKSNKEHEKQTTTSTKYTTFSIRLIKLCIMYCTKWHVSACFFSRANRKKKVLCFLHQFCTIWNLYLFYGSQNKQTKKHIFLPVPTHSFESNIFLLFWIVFCKTAVKVWYIFFAVYALLLMFSS